MAPYPLARAFLQDTGARDRSLVITVLSPARKNGSSRCIATALPLLTDGARASPAEPEDQATAKLLGGRIPILEIKVRALATRSSHILREKRRRRATTIRSIVFAVESNISYLC